MPHTNLIVLDLFKYVRPVARQRLAFPKDLAYSNKPTPILSVRIAVIPLAARRFRPPPTLLPSLRTALKPFRWAAARPRSIQVTIDDLDLAAQPMHAPVRPSHTGGVDFRFIRRTLHFAGLAER